MALTKPHRWVIGNWKQNGTRATNAALLSGIAALATSPDATLAVCPPAVYLTDAVSALSGSKACVGVQNVSATADGAFTGEIGARMAAECGAMLALVGHSERRAGYGETDAIVAAKCQQAQAAGLTTVVCVGETAAERDAGAAQSVVGRQLAAVLAAGLDFAKLVLAYEPVWAIGTGRTATPEQAAAMHDFIRQQLLAARPGGADVSILYGGSVKPDNAVALFSQPNVDGGLIGGASLKLADFAGIWNALPE